MRTARSKEARTQIGRYFAEIRDYPILTRDEEIRLGERIADGLEDSVEHLVVSNLRFVVKIAMEYKHLGLPMEDLLNEGNIGLIKAAHRYDHTKGFKFITYATWWIRKSIIDALLSQRLVRIPHYQLKKYNSMKADLQAEHARHDPQGPDRICPSCEQEPDNPLRPVLSLNGTGEDGDGREMIDRLADELAEDPENASIRKMCLARLEECLSRLDPRERRVLALRFGLRNRGEATLQEIGTAMGLSKERIRQIQANAIEKLRVEMLGDGYAAPQGSRQPRSEDH